MVFYEITAEIRNYDALLEENRHPRKKDELCPTDFQTPTTQAFEACGRKCGIFIQSIRKDGASLLCGALAPSRGSVEKQLPHFLKCAGIEAGGIERKETTMRVMQSMLRTAERHGYVEDENIFLEAFALRDFLRFAPHHLEYTEEILRDAPTKKQLAEHARQLACTDSMLPELERIFQGAARPEAIGHPVHYLLCADDDGMLHGMTTMLASALVTAGRIQNQRLCSVVCHEADERYREYLDQLYRYSEGGAVAIDLRDLAGEDGDRVQGDAEALVVLCDIVRKYKNKVLTILCLARSHEKTKSILMDNMEGVSFVELREDELSGERGRRYLRSLAKNDGITGARSLMKLVDDPERRWRPSELNAAYDRWFAGYLKKDAYPQYADIAAVGRGEDAKKPVGSAYAELEAMIGLAAAKSVIGQALDYHKARKLFSNRGVKMPAPAMHMVFTGAPGTAKTTVARLLARIMKENGVLPYGSLYEVGRSDLVGRYVGWTAQLVKQKFRAAKGGVLFIDEAYSLVDDREGMYGDEAINTIVQEMENCREDTVVIFAGYLDKMEQFLDRNPGLRSRIAFHVPFEDYSEEELVSIAASMAEARGLRFAPGVREKLELIMREGRRQPDFGNGRFVRGLVQKAAMCQASRLVHGDVESVSDAELRTLLPEDFEAPATSPRTERRTIGFMA